MINAKKLFQLDDSMSLLNNDLYKIRTEISRLLAENNDFYNRESIGSLIVKRDLLNRQISNLQKHRKQYLM